MLNAPRYRPDVDGLRAIAVLAVVGYHAFPDLVPGGFVGVDVFFVVSGYLITGLILGSLERGRFSFAEFYARRVKRIFPALIAVLLSCGALGWFVLLPDEYRQLGKHVAAGAGFVSNFMLWREADYFDVLSDLKPLLHLWSLGIEEQFYIAWPILLYAFWRRQTALLALTLILSAGSLALNVATVRTDAVAAFYSPLARGFELLAGSLLAMKPARAPIPDGLRASASVVGLLLIAAALLLVDRNRLFPGAWALLPVAGTCLILAAGEEAWLNRHLLARSALVRVGLISYPLYLWHWPLLSFARIFERDEPSPALRGALVAASVALAWMTFAAIEAPIRFGRPARAKVAALCALMLFAGLGGLAVFRLQGLPSRSVGASARNIMAQAEWPYWEDEACVRKYAMTPCQASGARPTVMVLGDSHANHLYPGLALTAPALDVLQAGTCPPLEGVALHVLKNQDKHPCATTDYLELNKRVLRQHPEIRTVLLVALWRNAITGELANARERSIWGGVRLVPADPREAGMSNAELVLRGLERTIASLRALGVRVVLLRDTPDIASEL
ncbi:MAG TPA: acyltransferase family protein, partial [Burkholderiales bacterium]|nr:acyltransferase family protein [Burkholderiales bacterium]